VHFLQCVVAFFGFGKLASISQKMKIIPENVKLGYGQKEYWIKKC